MDEKNETQGAALHGKDGHVHLHVAEPEAADRGKDGTPPWDWARWLVVAFGLSSVAFFVSSFFRPWWHFWLYAPQYPKGLELSISLTGMGGDVHEIDILNHYIGMGHLENAAPTERHLAGYGVAAIAIITLALLMLSGRKLNKLVAIPAIAFPVVFLADSFYWLFTFGHQLDPHAPLRIAAFTPQMFGNGKIGQFETFAQPSFGFWLALAGVVCAVASTVVRSRVCAHCGRASECAAVCPRAMVLPDRHEKKAA
jgi:copper chaperone NosL